MSVSHLVILLADQLVHEGEICSLEVVPAHRTLGHKQYQISDVIMTHLKPPHLHAVFMKIFSVRQEAISENDLGADTALFVRLTGTLGTDKLIVHCDYLAMNDSLTEGTPREHNIT